MAKYGDTTVIESLLENNINDTYVFTDRVGFNLAFGLVDYN